MSTYAIGDVQGCYQELQLLLKKINFDEQQDRLWFTGDLVNRGPHSLEVLRFVKNLGSRAVTVLGNHDLHYLAVAAGAAELQPEDTFQSVLESKEADTLFDWMRHRPLIYREKNFLLVHAGIAPQWNIDTVFQYAHEVESVLQGKNYFPFLKNMYGNAPAQWDNALKGKARLRIIVNYFTRMRCIDKKGNLALNYKGKAGEQPEGCEPWFKTPSCLVPRFEIIFGHWAALSGKTDTPHYWALDTGCCWGNALTALRLEDLNYFSIKCHASGVNRHD